MSIPESIAAARDRIDSATSACGRTDSVTLELAVKTRTPEECRAAATALAEAGLPILLGHNRVQEARATVDAIREKIDTRATGPFPVFVEVNVSGEATKHGCAPADVARLIDTVEASAHLQLAGFMTVGLNSSVEADVRAAYAQLRDIRDEAAVRLSIEESELALSMGMSQDLEWAIAEGATIVRLGTAIFGARRL